MARKPKVYRAEIDGLHQWIVAAPNQNAALAAFGVHQNLFQHGLAAATVDPVAVEAALAEPGVPLRRIKGSSGPFKPANTQSAEAWDRAAKAAGARSGRPRARPKRDRTALDHAEAALKAFESRAQSEREALEADARAIQEKQERLLHGQGLERAKLHRTVEAARRRYGESD